jgi:hypothetical protein
MKRPIPFYFVVIWYLFVFCHLLGYFFGLMEHFRNRGVIPNEWWPSLSLGLGLMLLVALWQGVRLLTLNAFSLKLAIIVFTCSTARFILIVSLLVPRAPILVRPVVGCSIYAALNIVCIWYLGRRSFRNFAAQFVIERTSSSRMSDARGVSSP